MQDKGRRTLLQPSHPDQDLGGVAFKRLAVGSGSNKNQETKSCMQVHATLIMSNLIQVSPDVTTRLDDRIGRVKPRSMYLENGSVTLILS